MTAIGLSLLSGLLFGLGLLVSGMINPDKVLGFLTVSGPWDPSLAFVMIGAIPLAAGGFRLATSMAKPWASDHFPKRAGQGIDRRLVVGAILFGAGWGLVGYCPGPALAAMMSFSPSPILFVAAMGIGMRLCDRMTR